MPSPPSRATTAGEQGSSHQPALPQPVPLDGTDWAEEADANERSASSHRHLPAEHAPPDAGTQPSTRLTSPPPSSETPPQPLHGALDSTALPVRPPPRTSSPARKGEKRPRHRWRKPATTTGGRGGKELATAERGFALPLAGAGRTRRVGFSFFHGFLNGSMELYTEEERTNELSVSVCSKHCRMPHSLASLQLVLSMLKLQNRLAFG